MNLQDKKYFSKFPNPTDSQVKQKFNLGLSYLKTAKYLFEQRGILSDENTNKIIYDNIYDAAKSIGEAALLSAGHRAQKGEGYHTRVFEGSKLILNNSDFDGLFSRIDRMRRTRHKIDYGISTPDISDAGITAAIKDIQQFADEVKKYMGRERKVENELL